MVGKMVEIMVEKNGKTKNGRKWKGKGGGGWYHISKFRNNNGLVMG